MGHTEVLPVKMKMKYLKINFSNFLGEKRFLGQNFAPTDPEKVSRVMSKRNARRETAPVRTDPRHSSPGTAPSILSSGRRIKRAKGWTIGGRATLMYDVNL